MKKLINLNWIAILIIALIPLAGVKANERVMVNAGTVESLNKQLYVELKDVMSLPVNLVYQDKDIIGNAFALIKVNKEGKLELVGVSSDNEVLKKVVTEKINSRNMWTDRKYANAIFIFKIEMI
jgi:hypothetical protein